MEIHHYYSRYREYAITISHYLKICHYVPFRCVYKKIGPKYPRPSSSSRPLSPLFHDVQLLLRQFAAVGEDDDRDLGVAEHGELVRLLNQAVVALEEGDLAVDLVLDPLQLHPPPPHG